MTQEHISNLLDLYYTLTRKSNKDLSSHDYELIKLLEQQIVAYMHTTENVNE